MSLTLTPISAPTGYVRPEGETPTEYPKWVHFKDKPSFIVNDAEQEAAALAGEAVKPIKVAEVAAAPVPTLVGGNDEMAMLKKIAEEKGIRLDGRWNIAKVRKAVAAASPLPSTDPV